MDTEARAMIEQVCDGILRQVDRAYMAQCGRANKAPDRLWRAMVEGGLFALGMPEDYGGVGGDITAAIYALDLLGRAGIFPTRYVTTQMAMITLARNANEAQKRQYLAPTVAGDLFWSFALTEADAGTNSFKIRTRAERQPNGDYIINGAKMWITGIHDADWSILVARTSGFEADDRRVGMSAFIIDPKSPGITINPLDIGVHMADKSNEVVFENVVVPAENLLAAEGRGLNALFDCLNPERLMAAGLNVGLADYILSKTADYAKVRAPFDVPIGSYQGVQVPMGHAKVRVESARALAYHAAAKYGRGEEAGLESNMAKAAAADAIMAAADIGMNTFGGASLDMQQDMIPFYLWAKFQEIAPINKNVTLCHIAMNSWGLPKSY